MNKKPQDLFLGAFVIGGHSQNIKSVFLIFHLPSRKAILVLEELEILSFQVFDSWRFYRLLCLISIYNLITEKKLIQENTI